MCTRTYLLGFSLFRSFCALFMLLFVVDPCLITLISVVVVQKNCCLILPFQVCLFLRLFDRFLSKSNTP